MRSPRRAFGLFRFLTPTRVSFVLLCVAVYGSLMYWRYFGKPSPTGVEAEALAALQDLYKLEYFATDSEGRVIDLRLEGSRFDDGALKYVSQFKMLQGLSLAWSEVSDTGLQKLRSLHRIRRITLVGTAVTDRGLEQLCGLPTLRQVWLDENDELTAAGIASLKLCSPRTRIHVMNRSR